ncbi:MAG TPA: GMC family oxidoreductase, partial [Pyrinomonadaceae bacterium]|nr:GMC family oxidoreductase [Pyrinomonadaceae bacterium]
ETQFFKATYQRINGGSTWSWRGNCPRFTPNDFLLKTKYGVGEDWDITYSDLEKYYCEAEREMGVAGNHDEWNTHYHGAFRSEKFPMENIVQSYSDQQVKCRLGTFVEINGVKIRVLSTPQARNSVEYQGRSACKGNGNCIPICPTGAKYDATVHLKLAKKNGVKFKSNSVVTHLEVDGRGRIKFVHFIDWLSDDKQKGSVEAKNVILATHGIESARILLYSGLANSSGQVGRNLMDHLNNEVNGLMLEPIYTFRGPQGTSSIPAFCDGSFRKDFAAFNITFGNDGWGRSEPPQATLAKLVDQKIFGKELQDKFKNRIWRQLRFSYSTEQLPQAHNRVTLSDKLDPLGLPRPQISYRLDEYSLKAFVYAQTVLRRILQELNATEIGSDFPKFPNLDFNTAGHIMGTCRMGSNPAKSVVNTVGKSHDHPNLYIVGSSVFTTGSTANPTLTMAALTLKTIDAIQ